MDILTLIGRDRNLFESDISEHEEELSNKVQEASFLVIGGADSIGQDATKEIFKINLKRGIKKYIK